MATLFTSYHLADLLSLCPEPWLQDSRYGWRWCNWSWGIWLNSPFETSILTIDMYNDNMFSWVKESYWHWLHFLMVWSKRCFLVDLIDEACRSLNGWNLFHCLFFSIRYPHVISLVHVVWDRNDRPVNFCQNIIYHDVTMSGSKRMLWDFAHISVYSNLIIVLYHNQMYRATLISLCFCRLGNLGEQTCSSVMPVFRWENQLQQKLTGLFSTFKSWSPSCHKLTTYRNCEPRILDAEQWNNCSTFQDVDVIGHS